MNTRRAFTLVEILAVVAIIGILVTLVTVAVKGAMDAAKRARISMQMSQIAVGLDRYKAEIGEYPPDMLDDEALLRHVKKRWPRFNPPNADFIRGAIATAYANAYGREDVILTPVGSLTLWLGGFPNRDGKLSGFYADPENPFTPIETFDQKTFLDLEFGESKGVQLFPLSPAATVCVPVIGSEVRSGFVPIVYFRGKADGGSDAYVANSRVKYFDFSTLGIGICVPYIEEGSDRDVRWKNPATYQLIHPGLDGKFGETDPRTRRVINSGDGIDLQDLDNLTNFSDYKELKSILP